MFSGLLTLRMLGRIYSTDPEDGIDINQSLSEFISGIDTLVGWWCSLGYICTTLFGAW